MKSCMGPGLGTKTIHVVNVHVATYLDSAIIADACNSNWDWWSELYALAYATLSSTSAPDKPYLVNRVTMIVIGSSNSKWPLHHFLCISLDEQWSITSRIHTFQLLQEVSLAGKCPQNQYTSTFLLHHHCQLATVRNSARVKYIYKPGTIPSPLHVYLTSYSQSVTKLCFSRPEFTKDFSNGPSLYST